MATFNFNTSLGQTLTFDPAADILSIGYPGVEVELTQSGSNTVVTVAGVGSVTLAATTVGQLHSTGTASNIGVAGGTLLIGDETVSDALDALGNTLAGSTGNDKIWGLGGGDIISTGVTGNDTIYGGSGMTDSTDGGDTITATTTGNLNVYGNAGNDGITLGATLAGNTVNVYGGLDNDTVTLAAAVAGSTVNIDLGSGNDTIVDAAVAGTLAITAGAGVDTVNIASVTGDTTVYGGTGVADSTDGADAITLGAHNAVVYANAGADTITALGKASGTQVINAGLGNDTVTFGGADAGAFTVSGGLDSDTLTVASLTANTTSLVVYGGQAGTDTSDGADTISVTQGSALLTATIYANAGADAVTISGAGDNASTATLLVNGGLGNDTVTASLIGSTDSLTIDVGAGDDSVIITTEDNGNGDEDAQITISNFASGDTVAVDFDVTDDGGDVLASALTIARGSSSVVIDSGANGALVLGSFVGNLTSSNFTNSDGGLVITNWGGAAATLTGGTSGDNLIAGDNGDRLIASTTSVAVVDKMTGGAGNDTFVFADADDLVSTDTIDGGAGANILEFGASGTVVNGDFTAISNVQTIKIADVDFDGTITLDVLASTAGITALDASAQSGTNNMGDLTLAAGWAGTTFTFTGGNGADSVTGSNNSSSELLNLSGGGGVDVLIGGAGADTISGGSGADDLTGNDGGDSIDMGTDATDVIYLAETDGSAAGTAGGSFSGYDVISNFTTGTDDFEFAIAAFLDAAHTNDTNDTITASADAAVIGTTTNVAFTLGTDDTDELLICSGAAAGSLTNVNYVVDALNALISAGSFTSDTSDGAFIVFNSTASSAVYRFVEDDGSDTQFNAEDLTLIAITDAVLVAGDFTVA